MFFSLSLVALLFSVSVLVEAQGIIGYRAANTSIMRDLKNSLHFATFEKHEFKYLNVTPFKSLQVPNKKRCQVLCVKELQCLSFNVGVFPNSDGQIQCELLATDKFNSSKNITESSQFHHFGIKNDCQPDTCKNKGICYPNYVDNSHTCECLCPYQGRNCEKVSQACEWTPWTVSDCSFDQSCTNITRLQTRHCIYTPPYQNAWTTNCTKHSDSDTEHCNISITMETGCNSPVGVQDGRILDSQMTASSYHDSKHAPWLGRLHLALPPDNSHAATWAAYSAITGDYLQIDLGTKMKITGVATQGRPLASNIQDVQWVTEYAITHSIDGITWKTYGNPCAKTFTGNFDRHTVVTNVLPLPITARYVRLVVKQFNQHPAMRVELYGCSV